MQRSPGFAWRSVFGPRARLRVAREKPSKATENRVGGSCRASFHPLGLPVCVASQSSGCRVFSCASPTCLRTSKPLGSLHVIAYSRSTGPLRWKFHHRPLYWSPPLRLALGLANEINARDGPANERNRMLPALHNFTHDVPSTNRDTRISHEIKVRRKGPTTVGKSITRDAP